MALERPNRPVTRSSEPPENPSTLFSVGKYYSIRADTGDFEEGFCIAKALQCHSNSFVGVYLEELTDKSDQLKVIYKESQTKGQFDDDTVFSVVVSVSIVDVNIVAIDRHEIEEILYSANTDS